MARYGWSRVDNAQVSKLADTLHVQRGKLDGSEKIESSTGKSSAGLLSAFTECVKSTSSVPHEALEEIIWLAACIASHAIATAICNIDEGHRYISLSEPIKRYHSAGRNDFPNLHQVLDKVFPLDELRKWAFHESLPGLSGYESGDLIIASNGLVAGSTLLWNPIADRKKAIEIKVMNGEIRKDGYPYHQITESYLRFLWEDYFPIAEDDKSPESVVCNASHAHLDPQQTIPATDIRYQFSFESTSVGHRLLVKHYIEALDGVRSPDIQLRPNAKRPAPWLDASYTLATADYVVPDICSDIFRSPVVEDVPDKFSNISLFWAEPLAFLRITEQQRRHC
ncbi:MAG: hypothetical protein Q9162_004807 [Coniocarpon cinnabarinum]